MDIFYCVFKQWIMWIVAALVTVINGYVLLEFFSTEVKGLVFGILACSVIAAYAAFILYLISHGNSWFSRLCSERLGYTALWTNNQVTQNVACLSAYCRVSGQIGAFCCTLLGEREQDNIVNLWYTFGAMILLVNLFFSFTSNSFACIYILYFYFIFR